MFITHELTPVELVAELLSLRAYSDEATYEFRELRHNKDLCPRFAEQVDRVLDAYKRHRSDVHDIQGVRDSGCDVMLTYGTADGRYSLGMQIKSYVELEAAKGKKAGVSLLQLLKSQYAEALNKASVDEWWIVLCTSSIEHQDKVRMICAEFKEFEKVKVIEPRQALSFYRMSPVDLASRVSMLLCSDDYVLREARSEVGSLTLCACFMLVHLMCRSLRSGERSISEGALMDLHSEFGPFASAFILDNRSENEEDDDCEEGHEDGPPAIHDVVPELEQTGVVQMDDAQGYNLQPEAVPSICALYFDQVLRYEGNRDELPELLLRLLLTGG
ncbi:hypothetical protein ABIB85_005437 [Bradyrhizobium sp. JR1.5]|uniref:hypothetical protein n=1 Tax=unclassified Bradyrhizobium TaxID=2631580 RepID=UPI0033992A3F